MPEQPTRLPRSGSEAPSPDDRPTRLAQPTVAPSSAPWAAGPPDTIGSYRILERLGEGGMGTVYLAEQKSPLERQVALKVIREGLADGDARRRFELEGRALARMTHPGIAQVFDAGTTDSGHPFITLEYVPGAQIHLYCDRKRLSVESRIRLFMEVCRAVQHAHEKGVIHRDLKPSNILVTDGDAGPMPKVIDFGIAKALGGTTFGATTSGREAVGARQPTLLGTPAYMSPEALLADASGLEVDTRSDVYSLGIVLCELLVGRRPFTDRPESGDDPESWSKAAYEEPTTPSDRYSHLTPEQQRHIGATRLADRRTLRRRLRDDLDRIVLKAVAPRRDARYAGPAELADDLERHLSHEPVSAGPESGWYRLRKGLRRHRGAVAACLMIFLSLTVGLAVATREAVRANREAATARQVSDFLVGLFEVADPESGHGTTLTVREALDTGAASLWTELDGQPRVKARLMGTIGRVYRHLGLPDQAAPLVADSLALQRNLLPTDPQDLHEGLRNAAEQALVEGRLEDAEAMVREALAATHGAEKARAFSVLSRVETAAGRPRAAHQTAKGAFELMEGPPEIGTRERESARLRIAETSSALGRLEDAERIARQSLSRLVPELGEGHPAVLENRRALALLLSDQARYADAEAELRAVLDRRLEIYGDGHPRVAASRIDLGRAVQKQNRFAEAEQQMTLALDQLTARFGPDHLAVARPLIGLGTLAMDRADPATAEAHNRRALELHLRHLGPLHEATSVPLHNLATVLAGAGRVREAETLYQSSLDALGQALPEGHSRLAAPRLGLGYCAEWRNDPEAALDHYRAALDIYRRALGQDHPRVAEVLHLLGIFQQSRGDFPAARASLEAALAIDRRVFGDHHFRVAEGLAKLASVAQDEGDVEQAEALYGDALDLTRRTLGPDNPRVGDVLNDLATLYLDLDRPTEAIPALEQAVALARDPSAGPGRLAARLLNLGAALREAGRPKDALPHMMEALDLEQRDRPESPRAGRFALQVAATHLALGDADTALDFADRGLAILGQSLGADHPSTYRGRRVRGEALLADGQIRRGIAEMTAACDGLDRTLGGEHPVSLDCRVLLASHRFSEEAEP